MGKEFEEVIICGGSITIDLCRASSFGVDMTEDIEIFNIYGATPGATFEFEVLFRQRSSGGKKAHLPQGAKLPVGVKSLVDAGPMRVTKARFSSSDGGSTWLVDKIGVYDGDEPPVFSLPEITGENETFNDECDTIYGWALTNATVTSSGGRLAYTKTGSGVSSAIKAVTKPPATSDSITYVKLRSKFSSTAIGVIQFYDPITGRNAGIWIGSADATTAPSQGSISIAGTTSNGSVRNAALAATGAQYGEQDVDMALHWDSAFLTLNLYFREPDGRWKFKARVSCEFVPGSSMYVQFTPDSPAGSTMEIDFITICRPNIMAIGDSICAGATLFSPNILSGLADDESTWMRHAPIYQGLRNNLIPNRGIPGNNSRQIGSRIWSVKASAPKAVFLHASTNDAIQDVPILTHLQDTQNNINDLHDAGIDVVLLNQIYGSSTSAGNIPAPMLRDYGLEALEGLRSMQNTYAFIDTMYAMKDDNWFISQEKAQPDGHPNVDGYTWQGKLISGVL